jgi:hypothetical protein
MNLKRWHKRLLATVVAATMLSTGAMAAEQKYIIATASTGGTFYPVGVGIATIASLKLAKYNATKKQDRLNERLSS